MKKIQKISDSEMEVMQAIWNLGGKATSSQLQNNLNRDWKPTTILTFLARLVEKGLLTAERGGKGKTNIYTALISESEYKHFETRSFLDTVHKGSVKSFMAALYEGDKIDRQDIEQLKDWFKDR